MSQKYGQLVEEFNVHGVNLDELDDRVLVTGRISTKEIRCLHQRENKKCQAPSHPRRK